jgi:hypothetical protein
MSDSSVLQFRTMLYEIAKTAIMEDLDFPDLSEFAIMLNLFEVQIEDSDKVEKLLRMCVHGKSAKVTTSCYC